MRWQCAPISQGMTVAPSSGTACASGTAAARTSSAEPTAAIRSSRTSMDRDGRLSPAIVTTASSRSNSTA